MKLPSGTFHEIIRTTLVLCGLLGVPLGWAASFYLPPSPSVRYFSLMAPLSPTSPEACNELQQEFAEIQQELHVQHEQCLRDAPGDERGDDGGTCSKSSCQALHTARDEAGKKARQEVGICRERLSTYLAEKRREDERARRAAEEAERDRDQRDRDQRDRDRERDRRNTERKDKEERDRQAAKDKADRDRRDAEDRTDRARRDQEDRARRDAADRADQQRRQTEALRQAHIRAVTPR